MTHLIRIFGERHTGTRAMIRMVLDTDGLQLAREIEPADAETSVNGIDVDAIRDTLPQPWSQIYREALKDHIDAQRGPFSSWKHGTPSYHPDYKTKRVAALFAVRNPYSWAIALHRRPHHIIGARNLPLPEFLKRMWMTTQRDRTDPILATPLDLWNIKLRGFRQFQKDAESDGVATALIRFEPFVLSPVETFATALCALGIRDITPVHDATPTKRHGDPATDRRTYYETEAWRDDLDPETVDFINAHIDWDLAAGCGYEQIDPNTLPEPEPNKATGLSRLWAKGSSG